MGMLGKKLRHAEGGYIHFWCPGCKEPHMIAIGNGSGPRWSYNGNHDAPTFQPSVLVTTGHYTGRQSEDECWCAYNREHPDDTDPFECIRCHTFVTDGKIQFLDDCTHELKGQTIDLPDWPRREDAC